MSGPEPQPAYLRWRGDNRIAGILVTASLSAVSDALGVVFGLHVARGSLIYIAALLGAAVLGGLIMTHNRLALMISKPLVLLLAGAVLALWSVGALTGMASLICCVLGDVFAFGYVVAARGQHWNAFMHDVRTGEDTPRAAVRDLRSGG